MSRSIASALAVAALVVTFGLAGAGATSATPLHTNGGASACCRNAQ